MLDPWVGGWKAQRARTLWKGKNECRQADKRSVGCLDVEFIHVNHSIPDSVGFAIHSPAGTVVYTGDFKIDCTPAWGEMIDLGRFAELGNQGVFWPCWLTLPMQNAPVIPKPSRWWTIPLKVCSKKRKKRIIIATFASNISRVQQIINCAVRYGRKVALSGRSMLNVMGIAVEMGYLQVPDGVLIDIDLLNRYPREKLS